jgi:hypothetical protein
LGSGVDGFNRKITVLSLDGLQPLAMGPWDATSPFLLQLSPGEHELTLSSSGESPEWHEPGILRGLPLTLRFRAVSGTAYRLVTAFEEQAGERLWGVCVESVPDGDRYVIPNGLIPQRLLPIAE